MNSNKEEFEAVKYLPADTIRTTVKKYGFVVEGPAREIIDSAQPQDIISVRITMHSPLRIIKAANVTQTPDIFAVAED